MSPNTGVLLKGVLIPTLLNNPLASCSFINFVFLLPQEAHFDYSITLPFLVFIIFASLFSVSFCTLNNMSACLFYNITNTIF